MNEAAAAPSPSPDETPPLGSSPPQPDDLSDYWAYKVAEEAKKKVLAYFGVLGAVVSVVVTLYGADRINAIIESTYEKAIKGKEAAAERAIKDREAAASRRVEQLSKDFDKHLERLKQDTTGKTDEFKRMLGLTLEEVQKASTEPPIEVDLSGEIGPIRDQGQEALSVGSALASTLAGEVKRERNLALVFSARSIELEAKRHDEWPGENYDGSSVSGGLKGLKEVGAFLDSEWSAERKAPIAGAKPTKISSSTRIEGGQFAAIVSALKDGHPVAATIVVTSAFDSPGAGGLIRLHGSKEELGGHVVCVVGYSYTTKRFKFANSWGKEWGAGGFGLMSKDDFMKIFKEGATLQL